MKRRKPSKFETYDFNKKSLEEIKLSEKGTRWPVLYYIYNDKQIYIGETTNAFQRTSNHLSNSERSKLKEITIISNDRFHKSATLDIESNLIEYINADNRLKLQNKNSGVVGHNYFERNVYSDILLEIWEQLKIQKIVEQDIENLANSDLFKYSPYKKLTPDQYSVARNIIEEIAESLRTGENRTIIVKGGAGTGKTVLAIYLMKLLADNAKKNLSTLDSDYEMDIQYSNLDELYGLTSRLVVPMTSLRETLGNVFKNVTGLTKGMVIGASKMVDVSIVPVDGSIRNEDKKIKVVIVDEAHRLRQNKNISGFHINQFNVNNKHLGLKDGTELDWITMNSQIQILFYDEKQSIKPTDITKEQFARAVGDNETTTHYLDSQMRVKGGQRYVNYINDILDQKSPAPQTFEDYDFRMFDNVDDLVNSIKELDKKHGLCRTVAGYSWDWKTEKASLNKISKDQLFDIDIQGYKYIWNSTGTDWVNSPNAINEIGSIHTIQGYDLNYAGVIFGEEITYDLDTGKIKVIKENYKDKFGKNTIETDQELHDYIVNIYKVFLTRGILGTYIYVCDDNLKTYFEKLLMYNI